MRERVIYNPAVGTPLEDSQTPGIDEGGSSLHDNSHARPLAHSPIGGGGGRSTKVDFGPSTGGQPQAETPIGGGGAPPVKVTPGAVSGG
ncbi:hypothetical protein A3J20_04710 [Candidatus Gottesmanbacteria bacterium RIFCSPLOWO2_02_FULL_42_29]|uniref:Uncharacterized protein n=2 Tax=Candidatus Gottesmaniibacteriota TaxID=1752720 RepID=A0A1F6BK37_9BACT|nr:MAG: hypothetical protein UV09_C0048G0001 [Candidatus Gottesmanbacteria bacterium GW2011_GWA2_42_18]KKS73368.1 MAG: hypothetical protein UV46_C0076G0001 [Candidatus Gottesmanbacteria bacterium GW2011_GWC2_42_8]OGG10809.1 MAG: hypothetical protein A2781_06480 [Candidatus Gottesmanbacteria bacterium RIFCSPHIGHO2_01_FULL_42_27]OGG21384.1 MAG: hypothetical protein A3E72_00010 [Candidatus Gottesmanbacteria bacterium RIFCSPHIGHO2_12_FULL_43_26]OGG37285.1 MAG: hypothetical protein A2968_00380 [Cand